MHDDHLDMEKGFVEQLATDPLELMDAVFEVKRLPLDREPDICGLLDAEGRMVYAGPCTGLVHRSDIVGGSAFESLDDGERERFYSALDDAVARGVTAKFQVYDRQGKTLTGALMPFQSSDQRRCKYVGIQAWDVTESPSRQALFPAARVTPRRRAAFIDVGVLCYATLMVIAAAGCAFGYWQYARAESHKRGQDEATKALVNLEESLHRRGIEIED